MAERRMFHSAVVESDAFLDMSAGAQALYFHLGMHADDDGFVNGPRQIARKLRRPPRELKLLVDAGFLLDFDGIMVIKHWRMANSLQNDRIKPLRYPDIAKKLYIKENKGYTTDPDCGENLLEIKKELLESSRNPKGKERKGKEKNRKEKNRNEHNAAEEKAQAGFPEVNPEAKFPAEPEVTAAADIDNSLQFMKGKLGKGVVLLTQQQMEDLLERMGLDSFDYYVERMADFILCKQAKVKNHYATILKWWEEDRSVLQ